MRSCYVRHTWVRDQSIIIACRAGAEDFGGEHLIFGRTKGGITENFEGFRGGSLKFAWKMKTGGIAKVIGGGVTAVK